MEDSGKPRYLAMETHLGRPKRWTLEKIKEEADYLVEWAKKDDSLVLGECYGSRGYSYENVHTFKKESEYFKNANHIAKCLVGARREKLALRKEVDGAIVKYTMIAYDPELKQAIIDVRSSTNTPPTNVNVILKGRDYIEDKEENKAEENDDELDG